MRNLVGRCFSLADGRYRIVDVRQMGGDAMVYAEPMSAEDPDSMPSAAAAPNRAAFHFTDIAAMLEAPRSA
jgi:uncharacterized protein (UPF0179 family)